MIEILDYDFKRDYDNVLNACIDEKWLAFYTTKKEEYVKALSSSTTFVAYDGDCFCGFVRGISDGFFTVFCCEIIDVNQFRRKGIGRMLMQRLSDAYPTCSVDVLSDNDDFYKDLGFFVLCNGMRKVVKKESK